MYHYHGIGGGGTFISKSGKHGTALDLATISRVEGPTVELPEDCLPSLNKLDRHLEAITINHSTYKPLPLLMHLCAVPHCASLSYLYVDLMDRDIKAALFDDEDEEGEFEELQDDFVLEVCGYAFVSSLCRIVTQLSAVMTS